MNQAGKADVAHPGSRLSIRGSALRKALARPLSIGNNRTFLGDQQSAQITQSEHIFDQIGPLPEKSRQIPLEEANTNASSNANDNETEQVNIFLTVVLRLRRPRRPRNTAVFHHLCLCPVHLHHLHQLFLHVQPLWLSFIPYKVIIQPSLCRLLWIRAARIRTSAHRSYRKELRLFVFRDPSVDQHLPELTRAMATFN
jgi:hypothetical protein